MTVSHIEFVYAKVFAGIIAMSTLLHKICSRRCPNLLNILWLVALIEFIFCVWSSLGLFFLYILNHGL